MPAFDLPFLVFVALCGAALGSFGNVLIYRVPEGRGVGGRSGCPRCGRTLRWFELVPVLSYVALGARCRTCRDAISIQYPFVEASSTCIALAAISLASGLPAALFLGLALWLLLLLAIIDARTGMVPDALSVPFILTAAAFALLRGPLTAEALSDLFFAVAGVTGFFLAQWILSRGQWLGSGDIFLAAGIAALLGSPMLACVAVGLAYMIGALVASVLLLLRKTTLAGKLAFGPFLACGGVITLLWGQELLRLLRLV